MGTPEPTPHTAGPWQFFTDHPLPWAYGEGSPGAWVEDANGTVLWRFDHFDKQEARAFVGAVNAVVSTEEAPYIRGFNRGWDEAEAVAPTVPLVGEVVKWLPYKKHPAPTVTPGLREALADLSYVAGRIHAGGSQDDLDRFEQAMIGAGMALRRAALTAPSAPAGLDVERRYRKIIVRLGDLIWDLGWGKYDKRAEAIARFQQLLSMAREQVDAGQTDEHGHYQYHSSEELAAYADEHAP